MPKSLTSQEPVINSNEELSQAVIHPTAIVDPNAKLGKGVKIGPYVIIGEKVEIGDRTFVDSHSCIVSNTKIGDDCKIYHHTIVGSDPQDLKWQGEPSFLEIGNNVIIREYTSLTRGCAEPDFVTRIGDHAVLLAYTHIGHDSIIGEHALLSNLAQIAGHVTVGDYAVLGGAALVHQFVHVGHHSMVGGGGKTVMDIMPYTVANGFQLKIIGINKIGLERRGFSKDLINEIQKFFRIYFRQSLTQTDAIEKIKLECGHLPEIQSMIDFVNETERGITR